METATMIAQNASPDQSSPAPIRSFGRDHTNPLDVLENVKAVVDFLDIALCNALSDRAPELSDSQIFGMGLIFQGVQSSMASAIEALRQQRVRPPQSAETYPRFDTTNDAPPDYVMPPRMGVAERN
jgi:hypothetical protein